MGNAHDLLNAMFQKQIPVSKCGECYMSMICPFAKEKGVTGCLGGYGIDKSKQEDKPHE